MRLRIIYSLLAAPALLACLLSAAPADAPAAGKSALESDPAGWVDLLPAGKDLEGWTRVVLPPDEKLNAKNPWSLTPDGNVLVCDGVGVKEMLLHDREQTDGVFHVEWRFRK